MHPKNEKAQFDQEPGFLQTKRHGKDTTKNSILLNDAGLQQYFDQLAKIAETRQNSFVKNRIFQLTNIIRQAVAETLQQNDILYKEIESLNDQLQDEKKFVVFLAEKIGFDPNTYFHRFEGEQIAARTIKHFDKNVETSLQWIKARFPEQYKKIFANAESN